MDPAIVAAVIGLAGIIAAALIAAAVSQSNARREEARRAEDQRHRFSPKRQETYGAFIAEADRIHMLLHDHFRGGAGDGSGLTDATEALTRRHGELATLGPEAIVDAAWEVMRAVQAMVRIDTEGRDEATADAWAAAVQQFVTARAKFMDEVRTALGTR